jgi:hypothetical protein
MEFFTTHAQLISILLLLLLTLTMFREVISEWHQHFSISSHGFSFLVLIFICEAHLIIIS